MISETREFIQTNYGDLFCALNLKVNFIKY